MYKCILRMNGTRKVGRRLERNLSAFHLPFSTIYHLPNFSPPLPSLPFFFNSPSLPTPEVIIKGRLSGIMHSHKYQNKINFPFLYKSESYKNYSLFQKGEKNENDWEPRYDLEIKKSPSV